MTDKEFLKAKFKHSQIIEYKSNRVKNIDGEYGAIVECFLLAVDFDEGILKLIPIPSGAYQENIFYANYKHCFFPSPKLRIVNKPAPKQTQFLENGHWQ